MTLDLKLPIRDEELPADFVFYRRPLRHQLRDFLKFRNRPYFFLAHDPRVRKTKIVNDIYQYRYEKGDVDALIVIAYPSGVHHGWPLEIEVDFPPELFARTKIVVWRSGVMTTGKRRDEVIALRNYRDGPIVLTMNCEAIITKAGWKYLEWFLAKRRVMIVADESSWAKSWSARTQKLLALGRRSNVKIKAILDGTPTEEGAGEIFFPTKFLREGILGYSTADAFRARYFEYEEEDIPETRIETVSCPHCGGQGRMGFSTSTCPICDDVGMIEAEIPTGVIIRQRVKKQRHGPGGKVLSEYEVFKGYRNLDELNERLFGVGPDGFVWGSRVRRSEVSDAPPKTYAIRIFELTPVQRKVYDDLRSRYIAELEGGSVTVANVLNRITKLQMVARNFWPPEKIGVACETCAGEGFTQDGSECEGCDGLGIIVRTTDLQRIDPNHNPALDAMVNEVLGFSRSVVWVRFRQDALDVEAALRAAGRKIFRYDGGVQIGEREEGYRRFLAGDYDDIVGTLASGLSRGHDLSPAELALYYSNEWSGRIRRQSEDRTETNFERRKPTTVVDLVAADTRDLVAIEALRAKRSIAELIMGDPKTLWI